MTFAGVLQPPNFVQGRATMKRTWKGLLGLLTVFTVLLAICGLAWNWLEHQRMQNHPARIFLRYEQELRRYGARLESGEVYSEADRGYALPQYLIDHGARSCTKEGDCFIIHFSFMPTDAVPELWYSPYGFEPLPEELAQRRQNSYFRFTQLATDWGECYWDQ
jgi:hypothetical protein